MNTVLLVDNDKPWLECLEDYLNQHAGDIRVLSATDGEQAIEIIDSNDLDLVIADLILPKIDGSELLSHLQTHRPEVAIIISSDVDEADVRKILNGNYDYRYLQKPLQVETLAAEIDDILQEESRGFVQGFTLANFLQLVELEQKTCTLMVKSNGKVGYLYFKEGELIEAETNGHSGRDAAVRIIGWESARTQIQRFQEKKRTIDEPIMHLLLKSTSASDENDGAHVEDMLEEAIAHAEGHHFKEAMALLAQLLKKDPHNHRGWLWYARISENWKSIQAGMRYAAKLAPEDPEVAKEIDKLASVKGISEKMKLQHCPICWCPTQTVTLQCDYCGTHLRIHPQVFDNAGTHKEEFIDQAAERYKRVVAREKNALAQYFLGIIRLNQNKWEEALHHLDEAVKLAPNEHFYSQQLGVLLNHMASSAEGAEAESNVGLPGKAKGNLSSRGAEKRTVLVVEDSPTTRKVISVTLRRQGFGIVEAADGLEALSKLNDIRPSLVLLDIILPKMDGYKILSIIKSNPELKNIPVVMLTSKDSILNKVKGKVSGCEAYLTKPFYPNTLVETVEKLIDKCR